MPTGVIGSICGKNGGIFSAQGVRYPPLVGEAGWGGFENQRSFLLNPRHPLLTSPIKGEERLNQASPIKTKETFARLMRLFVNLMNALIFALNARAVLVRLLMHSTNALN